MAYYLYDREIPQPLANKIISASLVKVGAYDWTYHKFKAQGFAPDLSVTQKIEKEAQAFGFDKDDVSEIITEVLTNVGTEAKMEIVSSLDLSGDDELELLSHVEFHEENGGKTELLYMGAQKFYVLSTTRSTLLPGNVISAVEIPLGINKSWQFDVYPSLTAKKPLVPEGHTKYRVYFQTTAVNKINVYSSPDFFEIIDEEESFGGKLEPLSADITESLIKLNEKIAEKLEADDNAPRSGVSLFPGYLELLTMAKQFGITSYTLNTIISNVERCEERAFSLVESDWHDVKTESDIKKEREEMRKKNAKELEGLKSKLEKELKKIKRKKVALLFDAPGVITDASQKHLDEISERMDELAMLPEDIRVGTKGFAKSEITTALNNTKPRPGHNLKVALGLVGSLALIVFVSVSWVIAKNSSESFNASLEKANELLADGEFDAASEMVETARSDYKPGYLRFTTSRRMRQFAVSYNEILTEFLNERIQMIESLMAANHKHIDSFTWEQIKLGLELCPENDPDFEELRDRFEAYKDKYIKQ